MDNKLKILMATYNGEKFIREQLNSILNQSYNDFELIIRDDGSKDRTVSIIQEYIEKDNRVNLLVGKNLGQTQNFNALLREVQDAEYVMFADQDDVWMEDKVELSLQKIKNIEEEKGKEYPIMVYSNLRYVDEKLNDIPNKLREINEESINTILGYNFVWGCTMLINNSLLRLSYPIGKSAQNHDYWIALTCALNGVMYNLGRETLLYRQHSNNVTGGINNYSLISKLKRLSKLFNSYNDQLNQNLEFCAKYKHLNNRLLLSYESAIKSNALKRLIIFNKLNIRRSTLKETALYYFYIFMLLKKGDLKYEK
ncbi:glycosyltransferase family 2 protein [Clostridium disporicum]|uniref:Glycosyl transferase family protein n=1 Tax=Clostridium disporicum TaxID=84024 RepID=A0A174F1L8_9CLOT|nr:glycosyltransferase family 2 protein [Clostridium disporicum]CUO43964.1 glycosyl transferase family protein [Clostridium disporicum]